MLETSVCAHQYSKAVRLDHKNKIKHEDAETHLQTSREF